MRGLLILLMAVLPLAAPGSNPLETRFHNEATDTARLNSLLVEGERTLGTGADAGTRVAFFARKFLGTPYVAHTLEAPDGEGEALTVNLDELDCTTFAETAAALAVTLGEGRTSWRDFLYNLRRLRYRNGEVNGYASRLHYIADWGTDNIHKGTLSDATLLMPRNAWIVRSIDYMTRHREAYPALADSAQYERMRKIEYGYRNHRFPYLRTGDLSDKKILGALREGDILAFVSGMKDLDVTHMGILVREGGEWHVLHASQSAGKVVVSELPLKDFLKRNHQWTGVRGFRVKG